jgi:hypothetical protein
MIRYNTTRHDTIRARTRKMIRTTRTGTRTRTTRTSHKDHKDKHKDEKGQAQG